MGSSGSLIGRRGLLRMHEGMIPFLKAIRILKKAHWKVLYLVQLLVVHRTGNRFDLCADQLAQLLPKCFMKISAHLLYLPYHNRHHHHLDLWAHREMTL